MTRCDEDDVGVATFPGEVERLVDQFAESPESYRSQSYNETQLRREFLDVLLESLGWDVSNVAGRHNSLKEVIHEDALRIGGNVKAPDYAIRVSGKRKFFVEAKKPSVNIRGSISSAYQLRRYAWSAKLPLSILTDFEEFAVYDCRVKPGKDDPAHTARLMYFTYDQYRSKWRELHSLFSRDAVLSGSLEEFAELHRSPRGTIGVDGAFLREIETWREKLARDISINNPLLSVRELNTAVQLIIDRVIFLRMAEDRGVEPYGRLEAVCKGAGVYPRLVKLFRDADTRYNSGLFHFDRLDGDAETVDALTPDLNVSDSKLRSILGALYYPDSPYEFSVLAPDTLGQVYEQFLGKTIRLVRRKAVIEDKPAVRKAGGVYYTPDYIVRHIVGSTVRPFLEGRTALQVAGAGSRSNANPPLRLVDPACGSGSFLIEAYQFLLDWYRDRYVEEGAQRHARGVGAKLYNDGKGEWRLTIAERRRVLMTHIYGVDVDPQAVEVSKLSLLLKVLEGESGDAVASQMDMFRMRALPDLSSNIKCGNSLIASDFFDERPLTLFDDDDLFRINSFDWEAEFPFLRVEQGFSVVLGNPPWVSLTGRFGNDIHTADEIGYLTDRFSGNTSMPNMYEYFVARGLSLIRAGGRFSFIVPDRFGKNDQFIPLREKILKGYALEEIAYRAPFPNVTADTLIFTIQNDQPGSRQQTVLGEFGSPPSQVAQEALCNAANRYRFEDVAAAPLAAALDRLCSGGRALPLAGVIQTTSGFGGKSKLITRVRVSAPQQEILKGECITKYRTGKPLYFEFNRANITGRTTDTAKLGWRKKILLRKTGSRLIASYDDSDFFPEQSLYFTFGASAIDLHYLLGLFNSRLIGYIFNKTMLTNQDSMAQVKKVDLDALPIVVENVATDALDRMVAIAGAAKRIITDIAEFETATLEQRRTVLRRRIRAAEARIDLLTYQLYGLRAEEIKEVDEWSEHLEIAL